MSNKGKRNNRNSRINKPLFNHYLPSRLAEEIEREISRYKRRDTKSNLVKCIALVYIHQLKHQIDYVAVGSAYWKRVFGGEYHNSVIKPLLDSGILEMFDFGYRNIGNDKVKGKVGKRYRINPELLNNEFRLVNYLDSQHRSTSRLEQPNELSKYIRPARIMGIDIYSDRAQEWIDKNLEQVCHDEYLQLDVINHFPENFIIEYKEQVTKGGHTSFNIGHLTVRAAKTRADINKKELFFFKNAFIIADLEEFLQKRIKIMQHHYRREVARVHSNCFSLDGKRNPKTLRIYNDLSNFPSHLLQFIKINNKTIHSIDLRTSQLLLLANLLNIYLIHSENSRLTVDANNPQKQILGLFGHSQTQMHLKRLFQVLSQHDLPSTGIEINEPAPSFFVDERHDVIRFLHDVFFEDFYYVIQQKLSLPSRAVSKQLMFKLIFRQDTKTDLYIDKLASEYPTIMSIIASFKSADNKRKSKKSIDGNLSVFLQNVEAEIYIDRILIPLVKNGVGCFTRHDSVVVEHGKEEIVEKHIKAVFEDLGFRYEGTHVDKYFEVYGDDEIMDDLDII